MWCMLILTIILIVVIHWVYNEFFGYWKRRGVPHPRTLPLIGNLKPGITLMSLSGRLNKTYRDFSGLLYVGFYQFQEPLIIIRDTELVKTIIIKEFSSFHDNPIVIRDPLFEKNPFISKGQQWKFSRAHIASGMTNDKIKNMLPLMWDVSKNLIQVINKEIKNNNPIDGKDLCTRFSIDVTTLCFFGFEGNALNNIKCEFQQMMKKLFEQTTLSGLKFLILLTKPDLAYILNLSFITKEAKKLFVNFFQEFIKYRLMNNIVRNDFLDQMISVQSKLGENEFSEELLLSRIMSIYLAGVETNSIGFNCALYELGKNFEVQQKLQEEIDETMKKCNGEITYKELNEMNYLDMVVTESFRKYPPVLFLSRVCTKQFTLPPPKGEGTGPNVVLERGTSIVIPIYTIHMDPINYPEPEKFIPERFSEERRKSIPKCAYIPFGDGPRICTGVRLAITQLKVAVVSILANFDIKLDSKTASEFSFDLPNSFLNIKGGVWLHFSKRVH